MAVEFFGFPTVNQAGNIAKTGKAGNTEKTTKTGGPQESSFSNALQGASQSQVNDVTSNERAIRVAELKAQVTEGSYEPDLDKVASSLLKFLVEG
ncbi:MAG: hypothetical protein CSA32_02555 [Desulfobulbus propionicus]|nr:MAG: hypothetical protein CSA32_02555 [Desulfobulbus propionicus]